MSAVGIGQGSQVRQHGLATWGPRVVFLLGAVALVWVSAKGTSITVLWLAVAAFAACTVLFVGFQLLAGHAGQAAGVRRLGALLALAGVVTLGIYVLSGVDPLGIVSAALLALGLGWIVESMRRGSINGVRAALIGSAVSVLVWAAVLVLVLRAPRQTVAGSWEIALGGLALISLVVLVNAASEWALRSIEAGRLWGVALPADRRRRLRLAGVIVLALAVVFTVGLWWQDWVITSLLVLGIVALVLALVSDTHADVALLLMVVAVLAAAPREEAASQASPYDPGAQVLVALGDSYMSGEGADRYFAGTDDAHGDQCRRSPTAYPVIAAAEGTLFNRLIFLACSGARTSNVIATSNDPHARAQTGEPGTQTSQLIRLLGQHPTLRPKLVILTLGGNDAGFGTIGETCLAPGDCSTQKALFINNLPRVRTALVATYASLRRALPTTPILVVPYPQPMASRPRCDGVALTGSERAFVHDFVHQLDSTIASAARQSGLWFATDMEDALARARLQLCEVPKSKAGINFVEVKSVNGSSTQRYNPTRWLHNSLHPNARGHAALGHALDTWLGQHPEVLSTPGPAVPPPAEPAVGAVTQPDPQCSITDPTQVRCQDLTRRWELGQLAQLWPWLLLVLAGLVLLWAACVAVVSTSRTHEVIFADQARRAHAGGG
jgi:lysophospholipase L1-like esterase